MTFAEYLSLSEKTYCEKVKQWRRGQTFYNILDFHRPELAWQVIASALDPFYQDENLPEFLTWVEKNWCNTDV